jgi:hypothetical protein
MIISNIISEANKIQEYLFECINYSNKTKPKYKLIFTFIYKTDRFTSLKIELDDNNDNFISITFNGETVFSELYIGTQFVINLTPSELLKHLKSTWVEMYRTLGWGNDNEM